jgi:hypothetical protein
MAEPSERVRSGAGLQPVPAYLGVFLTDHIARSSLISMDVQVAIVTVQHMPWSTDDGSPVTGRAVARCAACVHTCGGDAHPLQRLRQACRHHVKRPEAMTQALPLRVRRGLHQDALRPANDHFAHILWPVHRGNPCGHSVDGMRQLQTTPVVILEQTSGGFLGSCGQPRLLHRNLRRLVLEILPSFAAQKMPGI